MPNRSHRRNRHVGVGLAKTGVFGAGEREVADNMQAVAAAGRPSRHNGDHYLRHEPDELLDLEYVEAAELRPPRSPRQLRGPAAA